MRMFCDSTHGGKAAALSAAKRWRDDVVARHPPMPKREYNDLVRATNTSGIVGVRVQRTASATYWGAETCLPDGRRLRKYFNVATFGYDQAREMAIAERRQQLAGIHGVFVGSAPESVIRKLSRPDGRR